MLLVLLVISCGNKATEEQLQAETVVETVTKLTTDAPKATGSLSYTELEIVNFDEFETRYLRQEASETIYVLNFWATWCKPCVKELPYFEQLHKNYKGKNVEVVLVSLDFPKHIEKQVIPFIKKHDLQSEIVLLDDPDANTWIPKVSEQWTGAIPATLFLSGNQKEFFEKSFTYTELETQLQSILKLK
jgi:thiol-disulfide isomerase/thioredoxin